MSTAYVLERLQATKGEYRTPCYIYVPETVLDNYFRLKEALDTRLLVSIKSNPCIDLHTFIADKVDGYDVASETELNKVAVLRPSEFYVNTPALTSDLARKAVAARANVVVDHRSQLPLLEPLGRRGKLQGVMLRVNPGAIYEILSEPVPKRLDHFGMNLEELVLTASELGDMGIRVSGLHLFHGSYQFSQRGFKISDAMLKLAEAVESRLGYALEKLNLGGGFSPTWDEEDVDFAQYRAHLSPLKARYTVYHEAGRAIFSTAGYFLTSCLSVKPIGEQTYIVCDGGIAQSFLLAQTENNFKRLAKPFWIHGSRSGPELSNDAIVVGASCNKDDRIGLVPRGNLKPCPGDVAVFPNCGAYYSTYTPINFLGLGSASEYILNRRQD